MAPGCCVFGEGYRLVIGECRLDRAACLPEQMGAGGPIGLVKTAAILRDLIKQVDPRFRTHDLCDRDRMADHGSEGRGMDEQSPIQMLDRLPICLTRLAACDMHRLDGCLVTETAGRPASAGPAQASFGFGKQAFIPERHILIAQRHITEGPGGQAAGLR